MYSLNKILDPALYTIVKHRMSSFSYITDKTAILLSVCVLFRLRDESVLLMSEALLYGAHLHAGSLNSLSFNFPARVNRERKCADTIGTVLVAWAGHFQR